MKMVSRTHPGLQRMRNEDALKFDTASNVAVLADGMGGLMAGSEASRLAVEKVFDCLQTTSVRETRLLGEAIEQAHQAILTFSATKEMKTQMGSTILIWAAFGQRWYAAHVGDSRLYRWQAGELAQLSTDHSLAQRMLERGEVESGVDVEAHYGHVLTQGLGLRQPLAPGFCSGEVDLPGQRFLLCSDGLNDMVEDAKIGVAMAIPDLEDAASQLLSEALDMGGKDNISLILIEP